jgi:polysaccharide biosynthesis transport protein
VAVLASLRDKKVGIERLMRNVTLARESFLNHSRRLEEAKIAAGLDQQHLSDIAIVEQSYVTSSDSDLMRRILIVALACVVGVGLGVASAFTIEFFNNSVRTPEDVEFHVGLPVVATIPILRSTPASLVAPQLAALGSGAKPDRA